MGIMLDFLLYKINLTASERVVLFLIFVSKIPATNCSPEVVFCYRTSGFRSQENENKPDCQHLGFLVGGAGGRLVQNISAALQVSQRWSPSWICLCRFSPCVAGDLGLCYRCSLKGTLYIFEIKLLESFLSFFGILLALPKHILGNYFLLKQSFLYLDIKR